MLIKMMAGKHVLTYKKSQNAISVTYQNNAINTAKTHPNVIHKTHKTHK